MSGWQERRWGRHGGGLGTPKGRKGGRGGGNAGGGGGKGGAGGRRGRRGGGGVTVFSGSIDLSTFSGGPYITITNIEGIDLSNFAYIYGFFNTAQTVSGGVLNAELSVDGSVWRSGAAEYTNSSINATSDNAFDSDTILLSTASTPWDAPFCISGMCNDAPTTLRARNTKIGEGAPARVVSHSVSPVVDTAIRFFEDGLSNWVSGTLTLVGVMKSTATVQSHDFSATPKTSHVFDIPAGHRVVTLSGVGLTLASTATLRLRVGTGDVFEAGASGYRVSNMDASFGATANQTFFSTGDIGRTDQEFWAELWGFNTLVPVCQLATSLQTSVAGPPCFAGITTAVTPVSFDQIEVSNSGGVSINAGTIYCVSYLATADIEVVDFASGAAATHDFTDLETYPQTIVCANNLTLSASAGIFSRVSTDGITFDAGATDYRHHGLAHSFDTVENRNSMEPGASGATSKGFVSLHAGWGKDTNLHLVDGFSIRGGGTPAFNTGAVRRTSQINTALRIFNNGAGDFTAGKLYRVGYTF